MFCILHICGISLLSGLWERLSGRKEEEQDEGMSSKSRNEADRITDTLSSQQTLELTLVTHTHYTLMYDTRRRYKKK
jgi:predicted regulator of Ras-like GTPase activity (Roadblock/LC7/MglB family)